VAEAAARLKAAPGVEQIAHFGNTLHVVGHDAAALTASAQAAAAALDLVLAPAETSLEDVFIQLMGDQKDNMG
jgi:ABC-2 type transport system ATP-binding protein